MTRHILPGAAALAVFLLGGCGNQPVKTYYYVPYHRAYAVAPDAGPECAGAAKRARFWCGTDAPVGAPSEMQCVSAEWDFSKVC